MERVDKTSIWLATTPTTDYPVLEQDLSVDTVVVGGGIAGLSVAESLVSAGQTVTLLESDRIASATTGNTAGKVAALHGLKYTTLTETFTEEVAKLYGEANLSAIDHIEATINKYSIDCDFIRTPAYVYTLEKDYQSKIKAEAELTTRLGLPSSYVEETPLPYPSYGAVRFDNQAQFHIRKYLLAIAKQIVDSGGHIFERTRAVDIKPSNGVYQVTTNRDTITAKNVVIASHKPFFDPDQRYSQLQKFGGPMIGVTSHKPVPHGQFISNGETSESIRHQPTKDGDVLIVSGSDKDAPQPGSLEEAHQQIADHFQQKLAIDSVLYRWFAEDYGTDDGVPHIGRLSQSYNNVYVATGFGGWGMTHGALSGLIIADRILGQSSAWSDLYDPFAREKYLLSNA